MDRIIIDSFHQKDETMNYKKIKFFPLLLCLFTSGLFAQVEKGQFTVAAGVGVVPTYIADRATTDVLPVSLNIGYRVTDNVSVNAFGGYTAATSQQQILADGILAEYQSELLVVGLRSEVHTDRFDRFDIYGGLQLSYSIPTVREVHLGENASDPIELGPSPTKDAPYKYKKPTAQFLPTGFVGANWYATDHVGAFVEFGYNVSLFTAGLQFRM